MKKLIFTLIAIAIATVSFSQSIPDSLAKKSEKAKTILTSLNTVDSLLQVKSKEDSIKFEAFCKAINSNNKKELSSFVKTDTCIRIIQSFYNPNENYSNYVAPKISSVQSNKAINLIYSELGKNLSTFSVKQIIYSDMRNTKSAWNNTPISIEVIYFSSFGKEADVTYYFDSNFKTSDIRIVFK